MVNSNLLIKFDNLLLEVPADFFYSLHKRLIRVHFHELILYTLILTNVKAKASNNQALYLIIIQGISFFYIWILPSGTQRFILGVCDSLI